MLHALIRLGNMAIEREQQGDRVFGNGVWRIGWHARDRDTKLARRVPTNDGDNSARCRDEFFDNSRGSVWHRHYSVEAR